MKYEYLTVIIVEAKFFPFHSFEFCELLNAMAVHVLIYSCCFFVFNIYFIIYTYVCVFPHPCVFVCVMRRREFPRIRDTAGCTPPYRYWDWNSSLLLKWQVLLIHEPSHQPLLCFFNRDFLDYKEIVKE